MQQREQVAQTTQRQLQMLTEERDQLQAQVRLFSDRRDVLYAQLNRTPEGPARAELQSRMSEIDARLARLDRQVETLNGQIAAGLGQGVLTAPQAPREIRIPQITIPPIDVGGRQRSADMRQIGGIMAAEAVALVLIGIIAWRVGMRRMRDQFDRMFAAQSQQMNQLQQAVDTVAVEVERISEGQRYVAKVLAEGAPASALPVGRKEQAR